MNNVLIVLLCTNVVTGMDPLVFTKNGLVRGLKENDYDMFLGIPYAKVNPNNPFGDAIDVPLFEGVYNATDDSAICPQQDELDHIIVGTLDCLRIHVYVPNQASSCNRLPVMVWIPGGGFRQWDSRRSSYGPTFLIRNGVILVTLNYRLGPYGFMALNRSDIPGNAGLRDQLNALIWVKENIAAFGGDENNITIFGQSAGATSIQYHMLSGYYEYKGLFHKAIMQSGSVLCDTAMGDPDIESPLKLAGFLGLETDSIDDALKYLSQMHPHEVIKAMIGIGYNSSFKPTVEQEFGGVKTMIKDKPSNLLKKASFSTPVIIGFNSREKQVNMHGYNQSPDGYFERTKQTFKDKIAFYFDLNEEALENGENLVRHFYLGAKDILVEADTVNEMLEFESDFTYIYSVLRSSRHHIQASSAPVFLYMFNYEGERNYMKYRMNLTSEPGAMHADEIGYLFDQSYYTLPTNATDNMVIHRMTTMWTDFAKTSNPTPKATGLVPFKWPASTSEYSSYAWLDHSVRIDQHPYFPRMAFWDAFFTIYGDKTRW